MSDLKARIKNYMGRTIVSEGHRLLAEALEEIQRLRKENSELKEQIEETIAISCYFFRGIN